MARLAGGVVTEKEDIADLLDQLAESSEDEFPDVDVVIRQYRHRVQATHDATDREVNKENDSSKMKSTSRSEPSGKEVPVKPKAIKETPLRRRKLGQSQTVDGSLLKPWNGAADNKEAEKESQSSKPRNSRTRLRGFSTEADESSRDPSKSRPRRTKKAEPHLVSSITDENALSNEREKPKQAGGGKESHAMSGQVSEELEKFLELLVETDDESDILKDGHHSSQEETSDFVVSDSDSDAWNSDFEPSSTPPTRRSRSPTGWAKPHRTLFADPGKKTIPSNKQPKATITNPTKRVLGQQGRNDSAPKSLKASQPANLEDAFQKLHIFNDTSGLDQTIMKEGENLYPILEPTTPKKTQKTLPASPHKTPKVPKSPWKPEHKEFWDPEVNFAWIDKHSPAKKPEKKPESPKKMPTTQKDKGAKAEAKAAKAAFEATKHELARNFLDELDERITGGQLAKLTAITGGLVVTWSDTLRTTAGRAHWKCKTLHTTSPQADGSTTKREEKQHQASIELASRVLNNKTDLLNTVAHEFCHLAVFVLNGKPKMAHGQEFKDWGHKVGQAFANRGIVVTTKHNYAIEYKYIWQCAVCATEVKRHSKSVNTEQQRCGACLGLLVQVKPTPRGGTSTPTGTSKTGSLDGIGDNGKGGAATTGKKPKTAWQEFVAKEMKSLSETNKGLPFKSRMAFISFKWGTLQQEKKEKEEKEKQGQTMKELRTAVEVLNIDDDDEDDGEVKAKAPGTYDIFSS